MVKTALISLALTATIAAHPVAAEPAESDLKLYLGCSQVALDRALTFAEASLCGQAYQRIKLSFIPGVSPTDFTELAPASRAAVNRVGYERYLDWVSANEARIAALRESAAASLVATAGAPGGD